MEKYILTNIIISENKANDPPARPRLHIFIDTIEARATTSDEPSNHTTRIRKAIPFEESPSDEPPT